MKRLFRSKNIRLYYFQLGLIFFLALSITVILINRNRRQELRSKAGAATAALSFSATSNPINISPTGSFNVFVMLSNGNQTTTATDVLVQFDRTKLQLTNIAPGLDNNLKTFVPVDTNGNFDTARVINSANDPSTGGIVEFGAVTFDWISNTLTSPLPVNSNIQLANLTFQVKPGTSGNTSLSFKYDGLGVTTDSNVVYNYPGAGPEDILSQPISVLNINIGTGTTPSVEIEPKGIMTSIYSTPTRMSALYFEGQPVYSGVTYTWGISSVNSIGTLVEVNGNIASFKPLNPGSGDIYVIATYNGQSVTFSIPVTVTGGLLPSPTLIPSTSPGTVGVNLKLKFQGVTTKQTDKTVSLKFNRLITNGGVVTPMTATFTADSNGIYSNNNFIYLDTPGTYNLYIKGPVHLTRKFANLTLNAGTNNLDFSAGQYNLLAGDIYGTANATPDEVDPYDYSQVLTDFGPRMPPGGSIADLDFDGQVFTWDYTIIVGNYGKRGETN